MIKKILYYILWSLTAFIGILFFVSFPTLLGFDFGKGDIFLNWESFIKNVEVTLNQMKELPGSEFFASWADTGVIERYTYTLTIFAASALLVALLGSLITFSIIMSPYKWRNSFKVFLNLLEGIPDLLVIFTFQFIVIIIYRTYQIKIFSLYGFNGKLPYLFPIIIISIIPAVFLAQFFTKTMEEEKDKHYVLLGEAKGMSKFYVYTVHLLRNIVPFMVIQYRTVFWMILSNLFLVEYMFNIQGYTTDLYKVLIDRASPFYTIVLTLSLFILPILVFDLLSSFLTKGFVKKGEVNI